MTRKIKRYIGLSLVTLAILFLALHFWAQEDPEQCVEYHQTVTETFENTNYMNANYTSVAHWGEGFITLNNLGANFAVTQPAGMGSKIYVCDAGDFTGDGLPDLIGLDIGVDYRLILVRNMYEDADGDGYDDDGVVFQIDPGEVYETGLYVGPASITVADYNSDGLLDFFFYKNGRDEFGYTDFVAAMYINVGTTEDPDFNPHNETPNLDFTSRFHAAGIYCNWIADHLCSTDIDQDGDIDILVISEDKIFLVRNPGADNFELDNFEIAELNYDQRTGFTVGRGGSSVDAADFDGDGDIDVIGGTVNDIDYLVYYENDGTEHFTRKEIPIPDENCTGTVATCVRDFNMDGRIDIFGATDRWNAGNEARMWYYKNNGLYTDPDTGDSSLDLEFRCLADCQPILPEPHDVDMSAVLDYDQDGDYDVILADANHSGDYYLIINELAPVYTTYGEAWSTSYSEDLDPQRHAITKVRITDLTMSVLGGDHQGLQVDLYLSNDGANWEFYASFSDHDIHNHNNLAWHTFNHFGSHFMWKAILRAEEDEMAEYAGASFETPQIDEITFEFIYVERREYARTSVATQLVDEEGQQLKLVIAGTFYFPGWQGHLRAYDVTQMGLLNTSYSELRTITRSDLSSPTGREIVASGVSIRWDAGELLQARSPANRTIYTALPDPNGDLSRLEFSAANVVQLAPLLNDQQNDNSGLINFVRGVGRYWKLGDINHSNPIVVGPPSGAASQMGDGYDEFLIAYSDRQQVLYVGANDGMLHCFDVLTGEELWAFIPYNLLPKLRNMRAVDSATGERYFLRDVYVDGTPTSADVYIDADGDGNREWRTILVCGQGAGYGSSVAGGLNYYFALDITDPSNPQPLWEFTHNRVGETWSVPAIGKVVKDGQDTWVAFVGSGYDNNPDRRTGNRFYAIDLETGEEFWKFNAGKVNTKEQLGWNIKNTIPCSPSIADTDQDGYADRVYFGDLDGRLWRVDVSPEFRRNRDWEATAIYEDNHNYPIITKPAVWLDPMAEIPEPRIYFGTGGDDRAPDDITYSFIALMDDGSQNAEVEWFIGDDRELNLDGSLDQGDLGVGEKVWADPQIADYVVYFSTLTGSIESVDPCESLAGVGKLYARFIIAKAGNPIGSTAFNASTGPTEALDLEIKTRSAVTIGESARAQGQSRKREVYIQEYNSTLQRLEQPIGALLRIKSWREVYKIIR